MSQIKAEFKVFENYYGTPIQIYYDPHIKVAINDVVYWQEIKQLAGKYKTVQSSINAAKEWFSGN